MPTAKITATGSYLPKKILTNKELEKMVDTSDEWIVSRTGMKERRLAASDEFTSDMGAKAAKAALEAAQLAPEKIDLVLVATLTPDYVFPSTAALIQHQLGAKNAAAMDFQAACSGYLYGLSMAKGYIESGLYKHILLVASEKLSSIVNYQDRNTCILFGDGAAACVISFEGSGLEIREVCLGADGALGHLVALPAGGCRKPASKETVEQDEHFITMEGKEVFKHAVRKMEMTAKECLEKAGIPEEELDWLVPHQANKRIIDAIAKRFSFSEEKVYTTLHKYGNTSASAVAIALDELNRKEPLKPGSNVLLVAFGAGLTWGAAVLTQTES